MYTVERISPAATTNTLLIASVLGLYLFTLAALPFLLAKSSWWGLLLLPMPWFFIVHWSLIHEAIHKLLLPARSMNELAGRVLSIVMGTSFHALRFGHLMHHKMNRGWQSEYVEQLNWKTRAHYYWTLFAGLYVTEVVASLILAFTPNRNIPYMAQKFFFPKAPDVATAGVRFFLEKGNINSLRFDMALAVALYTSAFAIYGTEWVWLLGIIALRAFVISFMDNFYHYDTPEDNSQAGKEVALPAWVSNALLNSNYHETHHLHPNLPWHKLPELKPRHEPVTFLQAASKQLQGPLLRSSIAPQSEESEAIVLPRAALA